MRKIFLFHGSENDIGKNGLVLLVETHTHNRLMALCPGLPGWAGTRRNIHPLIPILIT